MLKKYNLAVFVLMLVSLNAFSHGVERGNPELTASMSRFVLKSLTSQCQITNDDKIEIESIGMHMSEDGPGLANLTYTITIKIHSFDAEGNPSASRQVIIEATEVTFRQGSESINLKSIISDESKFCGLVE